jgi:hypothetical protein
VENVSVDEPSNKEEEIRLGIKHFCWHKTNLAMGEAKTSGLPHKANISKQRLR